MFGNCGIEQLSNLEEMFVYFIIKANYLVFNSNLQFFFWVLCVYGNFVPICKILFFKFFFPNFLMDAVLS